MTEEILIGHVSHYFGKIMVAAIELTDGDLRVGDTIRIEGHTSHFTQKIDSMQIDNANVPRGEKGAGDRDPRVRARPRGGQGLQSRWDSGVPPRSVKKT